MEKEKNEKTETQEKTEQKVTHQVEWSFYSNIILNNFYFTNIQYHYYTSIHQSLHSML